MNTDEEFEQLFKKLNTSSSEVPEEMWPEILLKMQRKKRFFFIAFMFACLLMISFGIIFIEHNTKENIQKQYVQTNQSNFKDSITIIDDLGKKQVIKIGLQSLKKSSQVYALKKQESTKTNHQFSSLQQNILDKSNNNLSNASTIKSTEFEQMQLIDSPINTKNVNSLLKPQKKNTSSLNDTENINDEIKAGKDDDSNDPISISIFASPDLPFQKINYTDSLGIFKKSKSSMRLSFTIGARAQYQFSKHFSGIAGLQFSQVNDKMIDANNNTINIHYKTLDLPLLASYNFNTKNVSAAINAGIILNILASRKSNITSASAYPIYLQTDDAYKKNAGVGYYAGINLNINQNRKISFFAEPYFKYRPSNIANSFQPFQQKINTAGILAGARFTFFKEEKK